MVFCVQGRRSRVELYMTRRFSQCPRGPKQCTRALCNVTFAVKQLWWINPRRQSEARQQTLLRPKVGSRGGPRPPRVCTPISRTAIVWNRFPGQGSSLCLARTVSGPGEDWAAPPSPRTCDPLEGARVAGAATTAPPRDTACPSRPQCRPPPPGTTGSDPCLKEKTSFRDETVMASLPGA